MFSMNLIPLRRPSKTNRNRPAMKSQSILQSILQIGLATIATSAIALEKSGTGFSISTNTVLTAYHVVENAIEISVRFGSVEQKATLQTFNKSDDWAILELTQSVDSFVNIDTSDSTTLGDSVYTLGFPSPDIFGEEMKYTDGTISSKKGLDGLANFYQISVPIQPGNSGGPLFTKSGHAIGLIVHTVNPEFFISMTGGALPQNINFALKLSSIPNIIATKDNSATDISIDANQKGVCYIRSTLSPDKIVSPKRSTHPTPSAPPSAISPKNQAQAKYSFLIKKLQTFDPSNFIRLDGSTGPILKDEDYESAKQTLDEIYTDIRGCVQEGWAGDRHEKTQWQEARTAWRSARNLLADHYNAVLVQNGIAEPCVVFGIDLYGDSVKKMGTNIKTLPKVDGKRKFFGEEVEFYYGRAGGDNLWGNQQGKERIHAFIHRFPKAFMGQKNGVVLKTKNGNVPIGILVEVASTPPSPQFDEYETTSLMVNNLVKLFEKKFAIKFLISDKSEIITPDGLEPIRRSAQALVSDGRDWCYHYFGKFLSINIVGTKSSVTIFVSRPNWEQIANTQEIEDKERQINSIVDQIDSNLDAL